MSIQSQYPNLKPSLLLDFANTKKLDPRITFTRTTTARYYDGKTVAKAEENLLQRSAEFNESIWTKQRITITANTTAAPDGTTTADTLLETSDTGFHILGQTASFVAGVGYVFSCFIKPNGRDWAAMSFNASSPSITAYFDVTNGVVGTATNCTTSIQASTNGFYRCIIVAATPNGANGVNIFPATGDNTALNYAGDITKGLYLWGAQLEQRSAVTAYTPTTTQPITNYIPVLQTAAAGEARFDHNPVTGESLGLLIEEQRSNLLLRSEDLDTTWSETRATLGLNSVVAPDGTLTADRLIDTTDNDTHFTTQTFTGTAASHTFSVYAKASGLNHVALRLFNGTSQVGLAYYNLSTGATGTVTAGTASIQSVGNGWYRCVLTATLAASASCTADIYLANADNTNSFAGNAFNGVALWGMQVEAGAFPTSYIKTEGSSVTRNADAASMTGANFSSWYRADEGTLYGETSILQGATANRVFFISDGTTVNNYISNAVSTTGGGAVVVNGAGQATLSPSPAATSGVFYKQSLAYKVNDFAFCRNGGTVSTDTSGTLPVVSYLGIGNLISSGSIGSGYAKKIAYYPARLTNAQLQTLTTV